MTELNLGDVATEGFLEASSNLDQMTALEIVQLMNAEEEKVRRALESAAEAVVRPLSARLPSRSRASWPAVCRLLKERWNRPKTALKTGLESCAVGA